MNLRITKVSPSYIQPVRGFLPPRVRVIRPHAREYRSVNLGITKVHLRISKPRRAFPSPRVGVIPPSPVRHRVHLSSETGEGIFSSKGAGYFPLRSDSQIAPLIHDGCLATLPPLETQEASKVVYNHPREERAKGSVHLRDV